MQFVFQVTYNCNLRCEYCYQPKTENQVLKKEDAFKFIDEWFKYYTTDESKIFSVYMANHDKPEYYQLNFFGGECLLYPELIMDIIDYFKDSCIKNDLERLWENTTIQFQTNGTLIKTPGVLALKDKYKEKLIWHITLEGTEECQDAKRKFADGRGSYQIIKDNLDYLKEEYNDQELKRFPNKLTFTADTIDMILPVTKALIKLGYHHCALDYDTTVQMTEEESERYYQALCRSIDYVVDNHLRFYPRHLGYTYNNEPRLNTCGAWGASICLAPGGIISNCDKANVSYVEDLADQTVLGNVEDGITNLKCLDELRYLEDRRIEPKQCLNCPIRHMCDECPMENLKINGNIHKYWKNCGWIVAQARAQLYFYEKVKQNPDYPYYKRTIQHIEETNMYDPTYNYWYKDNYKTEWVDKSVEFTDEEMIRD